MLSFSGPRGIRAILEASDLHDTNLYTLSTQTPRGQNCMDVLKKSGKSK